MGRAAPAFIFTWVLMSSRLPPLLQFAAASDTGRVRAHNEDAYAISAEFGLAIVADGMGGYNAGEVASNIATSLLKEAIEQRLRRDRSLLQLPAARMQQLLLEDIRHASASIYAAACLEPAHRGMGTTLVLAMAHPGNPGQLLLAHVGDSRAYCLRQGQLLSWTRDHSLLQQQIDAGLITPEQARVSRQRKLLTRGMGVDADVEPEQAVQTVYPGDLIMLCSDGLTDELPDEVLREVLLHCGSDLQQACDDLVAGANARGGGDNITVVLARVIDRPGDNGGLWQKLGRILSPGGSN